MPIHFTCTKCGKKMFAQDQFAGQHVNCPECRAGNVIPQADGTAVDPESKSKGDGGTETAPPRAETPEARAEREAAFDRLVRSPPESNPQSQSQPQSRSRPQSDAIWRSIARFAVMVSTSWMIFLLVMMFSQEDKAGFAIAFDILLIGGLSFSRMQMRTGPFPVFLTAALTVALSMPLLSQLGFGMMDAESLKYVNTQRQPGQPEITMEVANTSLWILCSLAGLVVSAPIWLAGLKVAAAQRMRDSRRK